MYEHRQSCMHSNCESYTIATARRALLTRPMRPQHCRTNSCAMALHWLSASKSAYGELASRFV